MRYYDDDDDHDDDVFRNSNNCSALVTLNDCKRYEAPNPREMAGFADMEPPTKNNSMSGQPSTASGWPKSQNAIASQPPGPTPDSISNCGVLMAPADTMTSRRAIILYDLPSVCTSTPSSHRCPIQPSGRSHDDYLVYTSYNLEQKSRPLPCLGANYSDYYSWPNKPVETVGLLQGIRSSPAELAEENLKNWQEIAIIIPTLFPYVG
uniref:Uncharacterized protein n=1 Tax=Glossina austeni TaxID=7395 RepID=A0A1A9VSG5_GLOAU